MQTQKGLNEDWLSFWLAMFLFALSLLSFADINIFGWVISNKVWTDLGKSIAPLSLKGMAGWVSLVLTFVFLLVVLSFCAYLLRASVKKFMIGFTFVFWLSYICWVVGHNAYIAATDAAKAGVPWSLKLTGEAGFIVALIVGLFIGNFMPGFANYIKEAVRPELYIKTAIALMGALIGLKSAQAFGLASAVLFRGLCAIIEAYLIYWALVYLVARKYFKFSKEWAAPLASGISICGVSAAIATGGAIRARPIVPIMVSSLVVIFAVIELVFLPFLAQFFLWEEPMVAGAWMGLAVKTDGAAFASGAIVDALIRAKAEVAAGVRYEPGWILMAASTTKLFIDIFISIWAFLLAFLWVTRVERKAGEKIQAGEIWQRFPKFVIGYAVTFIVLLLIAIPLVGQINPAENQIKGLKRDIAITEKQMATADPDRQTELKARVAANQAEVKGLEDKIKDAKITNKQASNSTAGTNAFRVLFFLFTFFTIGVVTNFKKLWEEGIGKLAAVYLVCLFGFIIWIGLVISWIFFHGVKPPLMM